MKTTIWIEVPCFKITLQGHINSIITYTGCKIVDPNTHRFFSVDNCLDRSLISTPFGWFAKGTSHQQMEKNYDNQIRVMIVRLINKQLSNKLRHVNVLFMNLKRMLFTSNFIGCIPFKDINQ